MSGLANEESFRWQSALAARKVAIKRTRGDLPAVIVGMIICAIIQLIAPDRECSMIKRLVDGMAFGLGFSLIFTTVWMLANGLILPQLVDWAWRSDDTLAIDLRQPLPSMSLGNSMDGSALASVGNPLVNDETVTIPSGGGLLKMASIGSFDPSGRPDTIQYWLTNDQLYKITTRGESVNFMQLDRPHNADHALLDQLVRKAAGVAALSSMTVISRAQIELLDRTGSFRPGDWLRGTLNISPKSRVVFLIPDALP